MDRPEFTEEQLNFIREQLNVIYEGWKLYIVTTKTIIQEIEKRICGETKNG